MNSLEKIQAGWMAYDQAGESIGDVQEVGANYVLISKGTWFPRDIYVPAEAISQVDTENAHVHVKADKSSIESMGWDQRPQGQGQSDDTEMREDALRVPIVKESLTAEKRTEQAGEVRVKKDVVEERESLQVPVTREEVTINRVAVDRAVSGDEGITTDGQTIRVPVTAEKVTVGKEARVVEELEISKRSVTEQEQVEGTVRREEVHVDELGESKPSR